MRMFNIGRKESGASLVEVMVAASILAVSTTVATQTAANRSVAEAIDESQKTIMAAVSRVDAETRLVMKNAWKNDLCLALGTFQSKLPTKVSPLGERRMTIRPLSSGTSYVGVSGAGVPSEWSTAAQACNSVGSKDGCLEILLERGTEKIAQGFVVMRLVPWNFNEGRAPASCADTLETEPGMGYRLNNAFFLEAKLPNGSIHKIQRTYQSQFANAVDGDAYVPPVTAVPTGMQGPNLLSGWRAKWPVPPAPGAAYTAWPLPYKKLGSYVVPSACTSFSAMNPSAACRPFELLGWVCDGTLFQGAKCQKHPWFK